MTEDQKKYADAFVALGSTGASTPSTHMVEFVADSFGVERSDVLNALVELIRENRTK